MDKKFEKIYEIAEREGWQADYEYSDEKETEICFSFNNYSPAGRDLSFEVCVPNDEDEDVIYENVADAIADYWEGFDVSYETYIWLDETGHGKNGAPENMKDVYEDTLSCADMIYELYHAIYVQEKPTETEEKQYVFEVFECDAWHSTSSMVRKATCNSLEEAVNLIIEHGFFDECSDKDYIRDFLMEHQQTGTGDVNYIISKVEVGVWDE